MHPVRRIIGMMFLGALGALVFELAAPFIAVRFPALERVGTRTTVVNTTQRVTVTGETALVEAISRIRPAMVAVEARRGSELIAAGSGIILTADGLVVTSARLTPAGAVILVSPYRGETREASVVRRDDTRGVTLLKISGGTLSVAGLRRFDEVRLGERVFAFGLTRRGDAAALMVTDGVASRIRDDGLTVALVPTRELPHGAVIAALDGNVVAIVESAAAGDVVVVDSRAIEVLLAGR